MTFIFTRWTFTVFLFKKVRDTWVKRESSMLYHYNYWCVACQKSKLPRMNTKTCKTFIVQCVNRYDKDIIWGQGGWQNIQKQGGTGREAGAFVKYLFDGRTLRRLLGLHPFSVPDTQTERVNITSKHVIVLILTQVKTWWSTQLTYPQGHFKNKCIQTTIYANSHGHLLHEWPTWQLHFICIKNKCILLDKPLATVT